MTRTSILLLLVGSLAAVGTMESSAAENYAPTVGEPHVDVVLETIEHDRTVALSDFRGKKVLLINFASW